ncbi:hypothetical protein HK102_011386 [Quaeritorhiza haematococci]|nr:hypothetical protein HK102_011386 [Quaeritorhiza haematococci]
MEVRETYELGPDETFFGWFEALMGEYRVSKENAPLTNVWRHSAPSVSTNGNDKSRSTGYMASPVNDLSQIPFDFLGGFVGYFGYEMKAESLPSHPSTTDGGSGGNDFRTASADLVPDTTFTFANKTIVFDHQERRMWLVYVDVVRHDDELDDYDGPTDDVDTSAGRSGAKCWFDQIFMHLRTLSFNLASPSNVLNGEKRTETPVRNQGFLRYQPFTPTLVHKQSRYLDNIKAAIENIRNGETYEVCLTTQIVGKLQRVPGQDVHNGDGQDEEDVALKTYLHLRKRNPAPYAAFLRFNDCHTPSEGDMMAYADMSRCDGSRKFALVSSSPERFLKIERDRWITMKPIKGTMARSSDPVEDECRRKTLETNEKDRAENLMIVDLIRNDLNMVSELDTVHVPHLMKVESYATVHQLVSTVKGKLRHDLSAVDAVKHSFPPGSMTGAPKLRTVKIIEEELETDVPRGPYSGVLGFFSLVGHAAEFSVVIRTAVFHGEG